jgi:ketosteroid isomerase-like protein
MARNQVAAWVAAYQKAWRTPGTDMLADLFTPDATYRQTPYLEPITGLPAIARMWELERDGPDETFSMASEIVDVDGDVAVVRVEVWYGEPVRREYLDLWVLRFAEDGRCRSFEEWPFWPGKPRVAGGAG